MRCARLLVSLILLAAVPSFAARPHFGAVRTNGPSVRFEDNTIIASSVTPGDTVTFAALQLSDTRYELGIERAAATLTDTARIGEVRFTPASGIRLRGVWLVVDSNGYTVAAPPGFPLRAFDVPSAIKPGAATLKRLDLDRSHVEIFVVRNGSGVWSIDLKDGAPDDADNLLNGSATADIAALHGNGPPPTVLTPGDVLFIVDHNSFEYFAVRLGH